MSVKSPSVALEDVACCFNGGEEEWGAVEYWEIIEDLEIVRQSIRLNEVLVDALKGVRMDKYMFDSEEDFHKACDKVDAAILQSERGAQ